MGLFFRNAMHDEFGSWLLGYTASGGPDVGLLQAVGAAVGDGDDAAYHAAWIAAGDRQAAEAEAALARGDRDSARRLWHWACACYGVSYRPLFGAPVDPRLTDAFRKQIAAFDKGLALLPHPVAPLRIPFGETTLPGYFLPATGREDEVRPLVIMTDGYDATVTDIYFAMAVATARRGYHVLFFDGPGQGEVLIEQGIPIRPDWEAVVNPVVDVALTLPNVDPGRLALWGWSLGGYLALRGASGEPRLAACIADPGLRAVLTAAQLSRFGVEIAGAAHPDSLVEKGLEQLLKTNPRMHWALIQRGLWVHGVTSLGAYAEAAMAMTLEGRVGLIRCPTLITTAESDPLSHGAEALLAELTCPKTLLRFTAAEGAGGHCEMSNRSLANLRILDWLDATLA
jgi:alpha-beta hydrolase superfamily lysophospholipase